MTDRFDPKPGEPYAKCLTCGLLATDKEEMSAHTKETIRTSPENRSHRYRVINPSREEALNREVSQEADDAIESAVNEFVENVYRLHQREGVSLEELTVAVKRAYADVDFSRAWLEYIEDEDD